MVRVDALRFFATVTNVCTVRLITVFEEPGGPVRGSAFVQPDPSTILSDGHATVFELL